jgi:outer membrane protein TolC
LLNWSPFTFGKRSSRVQEARERKKLAASDEHLAVFEHQIQFVNTYLDYWNASALLNAKKKDYERYEFNLELSKSLVENGLRPGADSAQYRTLWAKAKIALLDARKNREAQKARVLELLGTDEWDEETDPNLHQVVSDFPETEKLSHPLLAKYRQNTHLFMAEKLKINRSLLPDFMIWGTTFARGSAINFDGSFERPETGLSFSRYNYGIGFQISMPLLQYAKTRQLTRKQDFRIAASEAYEMQVERALDREEVIATTTLENALEAAGLSPQYVEAAAYSYQAIRARYDSGLINLSELLQAQSDLAEAEAEDIKIRTEMWKALLYYAAVKGDLELFIQKLN